MLNFHPVGIDDIAWVSQKLKMKHNPDCENCFGNIFSYSVRMDIFVAEHLSSLVVKCVHGNTASYSYPVGGNEIESTLKEIVLDAEGHGMESYIYAMNSDDARVFNSVFKGRFEAVSDRDSFDYVYDTKQLIELKGKKLQSKRNHISYFERNFRWTYEKITRENIPECLYMSKKWLLESKSEFHSDLEGEYETIKLSFDNYERLGYVGGLLRIDGAVVAYTMGEPLSSDTFCVHIEKAFAVFRGAYAMINREFVKNELSEYRFINREDDVGIANLRKAKISYAPAFLLEKYEARIN